MSGITKPGTTGTPVDPSSPGGILIDPSELGDPGLDPSYLIYSGGMWTVAPPPAGGLLNNYAAISNPSATDDSGSGYSVGSEWINTLTGGIYKCVDASLGSASWEKINITGSGNEESVFLDFTFASISPLSVASLNPGDKIIKSEVKITTAFDGVTPLLSLGTPSSPSLLFNTFDTKLTKVSMYCNDENFDFAAPDTIRLTLSLGGATVGAGQVLATIRRA